MNERLQQPLRPPVDLRALAARPEGVSVGLIGGSMAPTLHAGEAVRAHRCGYLHPGDAVLFESKNGSCMLHRVLFETPVLGWVFEVGDAGGRVGVVHRNEVIGRAAVRRRLPTPRHYVVAARLVMRLSCRILARGDLARPLREHR